MFAVIENGSRQHRVEEGDLLSVDFQADAEAGAKLTFDRVLIANGGGASVIGAPVIEGASVEGEVVLAEEKGPKLEVQKIRRRKNSRRHTARRRLLSNQTSRLANRSFDAGLLALAIEFVRAGHADRRGQHQAGDR